MAWEKIINVQCAQCDLCFKTVDQRIFHINRFHKPLPMCHICNRSFTLKTNLERHKITVHEEMKEFDCDLCTKSFTSKAKESMHKKSVHYGIKFQCNICYRLFTSGSLRGHVKKMHTT